MIFNSIRFIINLLRKNNFLKFNICKSKDFHKGKMLSDNIDQEFSKVIYDQKKTLKLNKKLSKGVKVLCKNENKPYKDLFSTEPTLNIFAIHFGNGKIN